MSSRDPDTGQFVAGSGQSGQDSYFYNDDVYRQHIRFDLRPSDTDTVSDGSAFFGREIPIAGGITRSEVAELVGIHGQATITTDEGPAATQSQLGSIQFHSSIDTEDETDSLPTKGSAVLDDEFFESQDFSTSGRMGTSGLTEHSPGLMGQLYLAKDLSAADTASGVGLGAGASTDNYSRVYRAEMDFGPVFDFYDELFVNGQVIARNVDDRQQIAGGYTLDWVVHEQEEDSVQLSRA